MILTRQNAKFVIPFLGVIVVLLIVLLGPSAPDRIATSGEGGEGAEVVLVEHCAQEQILRTSP